MIVSRENIEQARRHLEEMPGAMSGQNGHADTYRAAVAMVRGFSLDPTTAHTLLMDTHNPKCSPRWSSREMLHKVESAARDSKAQPGYLLRTGGHEEKDRAAPIIRPSDYHAIVSTWLGLLGDWTEVPEVYSYLEKRGLLIAPARYRIAALPNERRQGEILDELCRTHDRDLVRLAGLMAPNGRPWCPAHRLVIPWRDRAGNVTAIQRRRLDSREPRYVFPQGVRPVFPYGIELASKAGPIAIVEGAADTWAARLLNRNSGASAIGLPGKSSWKEHWAELTRDRDVYLGLDLDADREARRIADSCYRAGATKVLRWRAPSPAKDWADVLARCVTASDVPPGGPADYDAIERESIVMHGGGE